MLNLLKQIHQEQALIEKQLNQKNKKIDFYKEFFKKYNSLKLENLLKIDTCDLVIAMLASVDDSLPIEQLKDAIYSNRELIEYLDLDQLDDIINIIVEVESYDILEKVMEILESGEKPSRLNRFSKKERYCIDLVTQYAESNGTTAQGFAKFFKIIDHEANVGTKLRKTVGETEETNIRTHLLYNTIIYKNSIEDLRSEHEMRSEILSKIEAMHGKKLREKHRGKAINTFVERDWDLKAVRGEISALERYYENLIIEDRNRIKGLNRAAKSYESLEKELYSALQQKDKVVNLIDKVISKIPNDNIRISALKLVYEHNMGIYAKQKEEYKELSSNDTSHYQILLAKYGIVPSDYEVGTIMNNPLKEVEEMLVQLSIIGINDTNKLLKIIQTSDLETVSNYRTLTKKGIITNDFLMTNTNLFNTSSKEYECLMRNLALIQEKKINPHYFTSTEKVLITQHQGFKHNIETLESYDLIQSMKTCTDTSFLAEEDFKDAIDTLLELGFENNLEEHIELLNYKDNFNRLRLLKSLNVPLTSTEELIEVLTTDKFIMSDEEIENYIYNAVDHNLPSEVTIVSEPKKKVSDVIKLNEYSNTPRTYSFDGVLISKNKVHRNLSTLATTGKITDRLLYGVIKGSTLTDEEYTKVSTLISQKKGSNVVKQKQ